MSFLAVKGSPLEYVNIDAILCVFKEGETTRVVFVGGHTLSFYEEEAKQIIAAIEERKT
jgi:hypothetical protein